MCRAHGRKRKWLYGWPCGEYVVHYADGAKTVLPVRLTMNVKRFDTATLNRATNENRFVNTLKDCRGGDVHLYQWEWVNPRPDRRIVKVLARHDGQLDVSLVVFAVSGRPSRRINTRFSNDIWYKDRGGVADDIHPQVPRMTDFAPHAKPIRCFTPTPPQVRESPGPSVAG